MCEAFGCTNRYKKYISVQLHDFPIHNPDLLEKWISQINIKDFKPTKHSKLCSDHFKNEDYKPDSNLKLLKDDAFPTIFQDFPIHLQKKLENECHVLQICKTKRMDNMMSLPTKNTSDQYTNTINSNNCKTFKVFSSGSSIILESPKHKSIQCNLSLDKEYMLRHRLRKLQYRLKQQEKRIKHIKNLFKKNSSPDIITIGLEDHNAYAFFEYNPDNISNVEQ